MITLDPTEAALMAAVCAAPADDAPRLAYATWAAEAAGPEGVARADHIRRTVRLYRDQHQLDDATTVHLLTAARRATWSNGVAGLGLWHHAFVRGFVASVLADAGPLLASDVAARCPLQYVDIRAGAKAELPRLLDAPWRPHLVSLDLGGNQLTDDDVRRICDRGLPGLRWLNLDGNPLTAAALDALAAATIAGKFPDLHTLLLPFDLYDEAEGDVIVHRPALGRALRDSFGELPWLARRPPGLGGSLYA